MINTKNIKLTNKTLFTTLLTVYLKKRWWLITLILIISLLISLKENKDNNDYFIMFFSFIYPLLITLQYWRFANSGDNKIFLLERNYEIDDEKIIGNLNDGTSSTIMNNHLIKTIQLKNAYLLYISKLQFIYIPKNGFQTEQDKNWFEKKIIKNVKNKNRSSFEKRFLII